MIDIIEINQTKEILNKQITLSNALKRLCNEKDFVLVFQKYYCNEYVLDLVSKLSQYHQESNEYKEIQFELSVISYFQSFIHKTLTNGAMAKDALTELIAIPNEEIDYE